MADYMNDQIEMLQPVRSKVLALTSEEVGKGADPVTVVAALLAAVAVLAAMAKFGKRGQARDMVQDATDAAFEDTFNLFEKAGVTPMLSRAEALLDQGRTADAIAEGRAFIKKLREISGGQ
jgi:hypothetical protein